MKAAIATYEDADVLNLINPGLRLHNVCVQYSTLLQCTTAQIIITLADLKHIMRFLQRYRCINDICIYQIEDQLE